MQGVPINWWAVIVATLVNMVVGSVWYSKAGFGKEWAKLVGRKLEDMSGDNTVYIWVVLGAFIQSVILARFVAYTAAFYPGYSSVAVGLLTAGWAWLAFVAITQGVNTLFAGTRKKLLFINATYFLIVLLVNGVILASWH